MTRETCGLVPMMKWRTFVRRENSRKRNNFLYFRLSFTSSPMFSKYRFLRAHFIQAFFVRPSEYEVRPSSHLYYSSGPRIRALSSPVQITRNHVITEQTVAINKKIERRWRHCHVGRWVRAHECMCFWGRIFVHGRVF